MVDYPVCYFCGQPIFPHQQSNKHHVPPQRYGGTNWHRVHFDCHLAFNRCDSPELDWQGWQQFWQQHSFGYLLLSGLYAVLPNAHIGYNGQRVLQEVYHD